MSDGRKSSSRSSVDDRGGRVTSGRPPPAAGASRQQQKQRAVQRHFSVDDSSVDLDDDAFDDDLGGARSTSRNQPHRGVSIGTALGVLLCSPPPLYGRGHKTMLRSVRPSVRLSVTFSDSVPFARWRYFCALHRFKRNR